jgi:hypothetical protein
MVRLIFSVLALALLPLPAHAYFDPGAGVVMLQVLIAAGLGLVYRFRTFIGSLWRALLRVFRR